MTKKKKDKAPKPAKNDVLLMGPKTEDGAGVHFLRQTNETLTAGELRPAQDGKPVNGELVSLSPRAESPALFDVDVLHKPKAPQIGKPARVSSRQYRHGWSRIWNKPQKTSSKQKAN